MNKKILILIPMMVLLVSIVPFVFAGRVSTLNFNVTMDNANDIWNTGSCSIAGGELSVPSTQDCNLVEKLINLSGNTNNVTTDIMMKITSASGGHGGLAFRWENTTGVFGTSQSQFMRCDGDPCALYHDPDASPQRNTPTFFAIEDVYHMLTIIQYWENDTMGVYYDGTRIVDGWWNSADEGRGNATSLSFSNENFVYKVDWVANYNGSTSDADDGIDSTPPTIDSVVISDLTPLDTETIQVNVTATDGGDGVVTTWLADNRSGEMLNFTSINYTVAEASVISIFNFTAQFGDVQVVASALDVLGNIAQTILSSTADSTDPLDYVFWDDGDEFRLGATRTAPADGDTMDTQGWSDVNSVGHYIYDDDSFKLGNMSMISAGEDSSGYILGSGGATAVDYDFTAHMEFYDDGDTSCYHQISLRTSQTFEIGIKTAFEGTNYYYYEPGDSDTATSIPMTNGWHSVDYYVSPDETTDYIAGYLDGELVKNDTTAISAFVDIRTYSSALCTGIIDNYKVWSGLPENRPSVTTVPNTYSATAGDTSAPVAISVSINNTAPNLNEDIQTSVNLTEGSGISSVFQADNLTGIMLNKTSINLSIPSTQIELNFTTNFTNTLRFGEVVQIIYTFNDTLGKSGQAFLNYTVTDLINPEINSSFNVTIYNFTINDEINFSCNITDTDTLSFGNITYNISGELTKNNYTLSGTEDIISNVTNINVSRGEVINYTCYVEDIGGNTVQNSTLITIQNTPPVLSGVNINVSPIYINTDLKCLNTSNDPDGDDLTANYTWYINGVRTKNHTQHLKQGNYSVGNFVICEIVMNDSMDGTIYLNSSSVEVLNPSPLIYWDVNTPLNDTAENTATVTFFYNMSDPDDATVDCSLMQNSTGNLYSVVDSTDSVTADNLSKSFTYTTSSSEQEHYLWYVNCSDGTYEGNSSVKYVNIDRVSPTDTGNNVTLLNNTIVSSNFTAGYLAVDPNIFNATLNLSLNGETIYFNHSDVPVGDTISMFVNYNITQLLDGLYNLSWRYADKHSKEIDENIFTKTKKSETSLEFHDTEDDTKINMGLSFKDSKSLITAPSDYKTNMFNTDEGYIGFNFSFTAEKETRIIIDVAVDDGDIKIINDEYKGHLLLGKYGLDFEGTLYVNGVSVNYKVDVERVNNQLVKVYVYPEVPLSLGDTVLFISKTLFGLNIVEGFSSFEVDNTNPVINYFNFTNLLNNSFVNYNIINFTVDISDDNSANFSLFVNDKLNETSNYTSGINKTIVTTITDDGNYTFKLGVNDTAGNEINSTYSFVVIIDTTLPNIVNISPMNNSLIYNNTNNTIQFSANISEIYPDKMELWINDTVVWQINKTADYTGDIIQSNFTDLNLSIGMYLFTICANDTIGNYNCFAENYSFTVYDVIEPSINYVLPTPLNNTVNDSNSFVINISIFDESNITNCIAEVNYINYSMTIDNGKEYCDGSFTTNDGEYINFTAYVNDTAGNINQTLYRTFLENSKPYLTESNFTQGGGNVTVLWSNSSINVSYVFNDNNSHVENTTTYQWYSNGNKIDEGNEQGLVSSFFIGGYNMTQEIRPYDGYEYGEKINITMYINTSPPSVSNLNITTQARPNDLSLYLKNDTLIGNYTYNNFDNLTDVSTYKWYVSGGFMGETGRTVSSILFNKSNEVTFEVTPYNGIVSGIPQNYSIHINNSEPNVLTLTPVRGKFSRILYVECQAEDIDDDVLNYTLELFYKQNGTESQTWHTLVNSSQQNTVLFDITNVTRPQKNVDINCSVTDTNSSSSFLNPNGTIEFVLKKEVDIIYSGFKKTFKINQTHVFGIKCDVPNINNITINKAFADCNGDMVWDYSWDYSNSTDNIYGRAGKEVDNVLNYFSCLYLNDGIREIYGGCILEKASHNSWGDGVCDQVDDRYNFCEFSRKYDIQVVK